MDDQSEQGSAPSELELLKKRAKLMGITFSNNITLETLRGKINAKLAEEEGEQASDAGDDEPEQEEEVVEEAPAEEAPAPAPAPVAPTPAPAAAAPVEQPAPAPAPTPAPAAPAKVRKLSLRQHLHNEQMKLVRVRIQNLDPKKKDLPGEIFTFANEYLGTVRKYIPYGEVTDDGWHIPYCIYQELKERKFLNISTTKDRRSGHIHTRQAWAREFSLEVLEPLSDVERNRLAVAQAAAGSLEA